MVGLLGFLVDEFFFVLWFIKNGDVNHETEKTCRYVFDIRVNRKNHLIAERYFTDNFVSLKMNLFFAFILLLLFQLFIMLIPFFQLLWLPNDLFISILSFVSFCVCVLVSDLSFSSFIYLCTAYAHNSCGIAQREVHVFYIVPFDETHSSFFFFNFFFPFRVQYQRFQSTQFLNPHTQMDLYKLYLSIRHNVFCVRSDLPRKGISSNFNFQRTNKIDNVSIYGTFKTGTICSQF